MPVYSPLTCSTEVILEKEIPSRVIADNYQKQLGIDVSHFFKDTDKIQIYKCLKSGYRFYYPFDLCGDTQFYEKLEKFSWYYMDWKWEHEMAFRNIEPNSRVLEIGCGRGSFLERMRDKNIDYVGLELNPNAVSQGCSRGLKIFQESIKAHAEKNNSIYDVVCMFQVLEHVSEVRLFLNASLSVLKPGGLLIIGVPNNNYCQYESIILKDNILDMPPHHMGLWSNVALANLHTVFPIRLEQLVSEQAQAWHVPSYRALIRDRLYAKYGLAGRGYYYLIRQILTGALKNLAVYLPGHTIMAIYRNETS